MDVKTVWVEVFKAALPVYGVDKSVNVANQAVDAFDKKFPASGGAQVTAAKPVESVVGQK